MEAHARPAGEAHHAVKPRRRGQRCDLFQRLSQDLHLVILRQDRNDRLSRGRGLDQSAASLAEDAEEVEVESSG